MTSFPHHNTPPQDTPTDPTELYQQAQQVYWRAVRRLTAIIIALWLLISTLPPLLAEGLTLSKISDNPLSLHWFSYGSNLAFLLLILLYIVAIRRIERRYQRTISIHNK